ncbi:MAG: hypothetical protein HAW66_08005 [Shewanella sp.]|nr:hypothetical protein [Shewanella sp.]
MSGLKGAFQSGASVKLNYGGTDNSRLVEMKPVSTIENKATKSSDDYQYKQSEVSASSLQSEAAAQSTSRGNSILTFFSSAFNRRVTKPEDKTSVKRVSRAEYNQIIEERTLESKKRKEKSDAFFLKYFKERGY